MLGKLDVNVMESESWNLGPGILFKLISCRKPGNRYTLFHQQRKTNPF